MWNRLALTVASLLVPALIGAASAQEVQRVPLDNSAAVWPKTSTDAEIRREGRPALRIETGNDRSGATAITLARLPAPRVPDAGGQYVYSAWAKAKALSGPAYLEMWVEMPDGKSYFSRGLNSTIRGDTDWVRLTAPFFLKAGQQPKLVTLNLVVVGQGTVWIDDANLGAVAAR